MIFIREGLITKRLYAYEVIFSETKYLEVTVSKKKWCIIFAYRPPHNSNKDSFFKELNKSLNNIARKYENVLLVGDLNIDILDKKKDLKNHLSDLCDTFSLSNLISEVTCVNSSVGSSIDEMLANRPRSFHHTSLIETDLNDCHKLIRGGFRVQKKVVTNFCKIDTIYITVIALMLVVIVVAIIIIANVAILFCFEILVVTS